MNKKAFTLIELLSVIIILGIISAIVTVTVNNELKESKQELYEIQLESIKDSARVWAADNVFKLPDLDGEYVIITLGQLKQEGFSGSVVNPKTKEEFNDDLQIKITKQQNNYVYEIIE